MSIRQITKAWETPDLSMAQKLVLVKICDNANDAGVAFPSINRVAKECCCNRSTVMRAIEGLVQKGLVEVKKGGNGRSNRYTLKLGKPVAESNRSQRATGRTEQPKPVAQSNQGGCTKQPEPSLTVIEPSMPYSSDQFKEAWQDWLQFRKQKKKPMTELAIKRMFKKIAPWGEQKTLIAIDKSITSGWTDLYEPTNISGGTKRPVTELNKHEKHGHRRPFD